MREFILLESFRYPRLKMMKALFVISWSVLALATASYGHELPLFGAVPKLSDEWRVREREPEVPRFAGTWHVASLVLTNSRTGDFLSFCEEKVKGAPFSKVNRVPWSDGAADRFPGGYTTLHRPEEYKPVVYWVRNEVVDIGVVDTNRNTKFIEQALEYTVIFEDQNGSPARLAHGYVIPMGHFRIQVQHTSTNVITSDLAHTMISTMLWDYIRRLKPQETANESLNQSKKAVPDAGGQILADPPGKTHVDKSRKGETSIAVEQANPEHGIFEQKTILEETGEVLHWQQDFVDQGGKAAIQVFRKAMGHDAPVYEGIQYIHHHTYRFDGKRDVTVEFFGDGRIKRRTVNRYDDNGTLLGADVFRDGRSVGWVHGALSAPPEGFPPRGERGPGTDPGHPDFVRSIFGDFNETKERIGHHKHVLLVCIYADYWEAERGNNASTHHFSGVVVRSFKGDWKISDKIAFALSNDAPARNEKNKQAGEMWFVLTEERGPGEIALQTGNALPYDPTFLRCLELVLGYR